MHMYLSIYGGALILKKEAGIKSHMALMARRSLVLLSKLTGASRGHPRKVLMEALLRWVLVRGCSLSYHHGDL